MAEDARKQELQKKFLEYRMLQQHVQQAQEQLELAEQQMAGIEETKQSVAEVADLSEGDELQVPIANGVFVATNYVKRPKVLVNVGANVVVDRSVEEAVALIEGQGTQMRELHARMQRNLKMLLERAAQLEKELGVV